MMTSRQKKRLFQGITALCVGIIIAFLVVRALNESIQLYFTPQELIEKNPASMQLVRMGGLVLDNSLTREKDSLTVRFNVGDGFATIPVHYTGILPDLFREGQGVIVKGYYENQTFQATEVLTKHDERYTPKELQHTLAGDP